MAFVTIMMVLYDVMLGDAALTWKNNHHRITFLGRVKNLVLQKLKVECFQKMGKIGGKDDAKSGSMGTVL